MRKKRSWVMWCMVVVLALLALASPGLPVLGADNYPGPCTVLDESGEKVQIDAKIQTWGDPGAYTKVVCRGKLPSGFDRDALPKSYDGNQLAIYQCDILDTWNWYETITRGGQVTLTCYPGP